MFQGLLGINKNDNQVKINPICIQGVNCQGDNNGSKINSTSGSISGSGDVKSSAEATPDNADSEPPVLTSQTQNFLSAEISVSIPKGCKQIADSAGEGATVSYSKSLSSYIVAGGNLLTPKKCGDVILSENVYSLTKKHKNMQTVF